MSDNNAVIKMIAQHTKETSLLEFKLRVLGKAHVEVLNDSVDLKLLCDKLKKDNKDLREIMIRFEIDNKRLQESLDQCQRELMDR